MAVRAIAEQKTETEAVLSMLEALVQGELDPERRIAFLRALVELSAERATPILIEALSGPDLQLRREAVALLSNVCFLGDAEILALFAALSDPDAAMRQDAYTKEEWAWAVKVNTMVGDATKDCVNRLSRCWRDRSEAACNPQSGQTSGVG